MKKLNYLFLGLAGLAMASCSNDDLQGPADGTYQLTVNLPKDIATRAIGDQITAPQTLYYSLFQVNEDNENTLVETKSIDLAGATSTTLSLPLVKGNSYSIAFFSQATSNGNTGVYTYNTNDGTVAVEYSAINSTENYLDAYDCFSANYNTGAVAGAINETITLTRPMAQINWGTNDLTSSAVKNVFGENGEDIVSSLSVNAYKTFNVLTGEPTGQAEPITISNIAPSIEASFPIQGYNYLAMQYVLVPSDSDTYELTLTSQKKDDESTKIEISVPNAPLQANYRTNIYGGLLTDQANFNIDLSSTWGAPSNDIVDGAVVSFNEEGTVICETPVLPTGVTEEMMTENEAGAVAISADGKPVYIQPTGKALFEAMKEYSEIYLAKNGNITTTSHQMVIPQSGVTIYGNGATITGQEHDFALAYSGITYEDGSTVNVTISNLNGVKIWNAPTNKCTVNVNLTNCTFTGASLTDSGSLIMTREADSALSTINFNLQNCHVQNTQVAIHSTLPGTMVFNNCVFTEVGIPINIAKKLNGATADITVSNCIFNSCGIADTDTTNSAWNYAAPVRVVDNAGPDNSIDLLVKNCTFNNTLSQWDILLWDYRAEKTSYPVKLTVENCTPANPTLNTITKKTTNPKANP